MGGGGGGGRAGEGWRGGEMIALQRAQNECEISPQDLSYREEGRGQRALLGWGVSGEGVKRWGIRTGTSDRFGRGRGEVTQHVKNKSMPHLTASCAGDDCSYGLWHGERPCNYDYERVRFATAEKMCAQAALILYFPAATQPPSAVGRG